jgi:DNA-binding SARP family transcriptional activator
VCRDGVELELGGPLQRALLACLLLNVGQVVSREALIEALWDVDPPPRAARSLETKVSRLRSTLAGCATIVARSGGYALDAPIDEIDVWKFRREFAQARSLADKPQVAQAHLEVALSFWTGEPLAGLPGELLYVEREHLKDEQLSALEARIDAALTLGEGALLIDELQRLRTAHPTRERFTEQLMMALYRGGRQAEALEAYRFTFGVLRNELGLEPGPRLRQLEGAILRHDESLGPLPTRAPVAGRSPRLRALGATLLGCITVFGAVVAMSSDGTRQRRLPTRPGVILVDSASHAIRADVPVGYSQGESRFGYGHLWTIGDDGVMSEIDPDNGVLVRSIPIGVQPGGIAVGAGGIWVTDQNAPTLLRIDPVTGQIDRRAQLSTRGLRRPEPGSSIAIDAGSLWIARGPEAVDRLNSSSLKRRD